MSFAGVWRLIHTEATDANATPSNAPYGGDQAMGLISFSGDGRMVCVLCCPTSACVRLSVFEWFETDGLISQRRDWLIGVKV